jgi:glycosyltransferase involved in cell wall biosynthesis
VPSIAVIIPIRDIGRSEPIKAVINSIRAQKYADVELILVEQDAISKFNVNSVMPIKYKLVKSMRPDQDFNKSRAFNHGVMMSTNKTIVFHDADILVQADYLKKVAGILESRDGCHIGSRVVYIDRSSTTQLCHSNKMVNTLKCERAVGYFEGGSIACHKSTFFRIGGFNEAYEGYGCEDCDFFERLKKHTNFFNVRSLDFFHLWHDRTPGWKEKHSVNKRLADRIIGLGAKDYIDTLVKQLRERYPEARG